MDINTLINIIALGEGYQAEFKVTVPSQVKEVAQEVCAFANAAGGVILIGVNDRNQIIGITLDNAKKSAIQDAINAINPSVHCTLESVLVDGKTVLVISVPSGPNKPYVLSGAIYVRIGPNSQKLTSAEEMSDFFQQSSKIYFDEMACKSFDQNSDLDNSFFDMFKIESGISRAISDEQIISNLRLVDEDGNFKNGSVLFFGSNPHKFFEKAFIRCTQFQGTDKRYIVDDKPMTGPLWIQFNQTIQWLKDKLNVSFDIESQGSGARKEIWEIPETAFKEALINALSHRDYYEKGAVIAVEIFSDRVEISNPGGLVSAIPEKDFGNRSFSRNPLIFGLFQRMKLVEQLGSGIPRMRSLMRDAGLDEPVFFTEGMFNVVFRRPVDFETWIKLWEPLLSQNRINILKEIHNNDIITIKELSNKIGIVPTAIDKNLFFLKNIGLLERVGADKGGAWHIIHITPEDVKRRRSG